MVVFHVFFSKAHLGKIGPDFVEVCPFFGFLNENATEVVAYANSVSAWSTNVSALDRPFKSLGSLFTQTGGGDPVIWHDERDNHFYAITANGRGGVTKNPGGCGLEEYWSSPRLHGAGADWKPLRTAFLQVKETVISRVGRWVRPREKVLRLQ